MWYLEEILRVWVETVQGRIFPAPISLTGRNPRLGLARTPAPKSPNFML